MGLFGDVFGTLVNYNTAKQNLASQEAWNKRNLEFQKEGLAWQKSEANLTREREDTAIQRRTADLQAAGLNPLLAAGAPAAASTPVSTPIVPRGEAPQSRFKVDRSFNVLDSVQAAQALRLGAANITRSETENLLLKANARRASAEADLAEFDRDTYMGTAEDAPMNLRGRKLRYETEMLDQKVVNAYYDGLLTMSRQHSIDVGTARAQLEMAIRNRDYDILKELGVMDSRGKLAQDWLDIARLSSPEVANVNLAVDEGLDKIAKVMDAVLGIKGLFRNEKAVVVPRGAHIEHVK